VAAARCRTLLLVNPHNPTGHVFTRTELEAIAQIALEHDLLIISDEIHADLTYAPHTHIPIASLGPEVAHRTVTLTSATKAFNIAGIRCAVAHIGPQWLRDKLDQQPPDLFGAVSVLGVEATLAAWRAGDPWLNALRTHLTHNRDLLTRTLAAEIPAIRFIPPQATYLAWLDCQDLPLDTDPATFFRTHANIELSPGAAFAPHATAYARLNFATTPEILTTIVHRMSATIPSHSPAS
jgi:cystathionine beta-lyase